MSRVEVEIDTKSLKYVYFANSEIGSFTAEFVKQLKGVEIFNANEVGLERIDGEVLGLLSEMLAFWGGQNQLKRLEANTFSRNKKLEAIHLKFNQINYIHPTAFDELHDLYVLDLSSNKLKILDNVFVSLHNLVKLDLSHNLLESFDTKIFENQNNLRDLNLQKNNLKQLNSKVFNPLTNLEFINISFNKSPLGIIKGKLFRMNFYLRQIYLIDNKISAIDRTFIFNSKPSLEIISFRMNSCLNDDVLALNGTIASSEKLKLKTCFDNFYEGD